MQAAKKDALNTINQLPETADMDEIMYRLYVLDKVRKTLPVETSRPQKRF